MSNRYCWYEHCRFPTPAVGTQGQYRSCDAHRAKDKRSECHFCSNLAELYKITCKDHFVRMSSRIK